MEAERFLFQLTHPSTITNTTITELQNIIDKYPFFQAPRALQLKALKNSGSFIYNQKLKTVAAHTSDREVLFHFITSEVFNRQTNPHKIPVSTFEEITIPKAEFTISPQEAEQINDQKLFEPVTPETKKTPVTPASTPNIEPNAPLDFLPTETHSFTEWLQLTSVKPIVRKSEKRKKLLENPLIEKFLKNTPKIKPINKSTSTVNLAAKNNTKSEDLMTETLAKVYLAQNNYKKAIQAYKILSLKNPEKSGLFADQIRAIKKLQDTNL